MRSRGTAVLGDGFVSGIQNQMIKAATRATDAMLRNTIVCPKLTAMRPNSAVLSEAPIPDAVPTRPWARLKRPVPFVASAMTSAVITLLCPILASRPMRPRPARVSVPGAHSPVKGGPWLCPHRRKSDDGRRPILDRGHDVIGPRHERDPLLI